MSSPTPPVVRLSSPAAIVSSIPLTLGFPPSESLVLVLLHAPRGRVGLTLRVDLPSPAQHEALVADLVERLRADRPARVLAVVYTEEPDGRRRARASLVADLAARSPCPVTDPLLVRAGRFWSYTCEDRACCPAEGTAVAVEQDSPALRMLAAEQVLQGRAVLPSRQALAASLEGPSGTVGGRAAQACRAALERRQDRIAAAGRAGAAAEALQRWDSTLRRWARGDQVLADPLVADLVVSLVDVRCRDALAARPAAEAPALCGLLAELARRTPDAWAAPICTLYGWLTYCQGGGAALTLALERALRCDPDYTLALLLLGLLDAQVPPAEVRELTLRAWEAEQSRQAG